MRINKLTAAEVKNAKLPQGKSIRRMSDGGGLFLVLRPSGDGCSKTWVFRYRHGGQQKDVTVGSCRDTTLKEAREACIELRADVRRGVDPIEKKKVEEAARLRTGLGTFEAVAEDWFKAWSVGKADNSRIQAERNLKTLCGFLGRNQIEDLTIFDIERALSPFIRGGKYRTASLLLGTCGQVLGHARRKGFNCHVRTEDLNPLIPRPKKKHFAAATDEVTLTKVLKALDKASAKPATKAALQLLPMLGVRPGELVGAKWSDIDFQAAEWRYTTPKTQTPHIVPLSRQAVLILKRVRLATGGREYVFSSDRKANGHVSGTALLVALRRCGIDKDTATNHGFRATMRTLLEEQLGYDERLTEHQLAHAVRDPLGRAYNRTKHLPERHAMMQHWADYLDELREISQEEFIRKVA